MDRVRKYKYKYTHCCYKAHDRQIPLAFKFYPLIITFLTSSASLATYIMAFSILSKLLVWLLLLMTCTKSLSHQNRTNELIVTGSEEAYGRWINKMGSLKHSLFQKAKNKLKPCLKLKVHKDPKKGDFTEVQAAINSLPIFSHCRVVIRISHGIYR